MQATTRPAYSLLAGPPFTAYTHPWFNGRSVFHHSGAFEGRQEVYLGSGGGSGELHRPKLKINGKSTHIFPLYLRTGGPTVNKGNATYMHIFNTSPHRREKVSHIFNSSPPRRINCGQKVRNTHMFNASPRHTYNQCIVAPDDPMWTKIKLHTYIQICPHQLITGRHEFHK